MMKDRIKTVFIDLDDTLWWFTENSKVALRYVYEKFEIDRWCQDYKRFADIYHEKNDELWELYHYGKIEKDYLITERYRYVLDQIGYEGDLLAVGAKMNDDYLDYLSQQPLLIPGAKDLLDYLSDKYDVNVLSNGFKGVQLRKLKSGGIDQYINHLILSDEVGVTKPLPGIFEYALKECQATADSSVMIGDNYDADICGANNVGWHTIYFNWRGKQLQDTSAAEMVVSDLEEVKAII